MGLPLQTFASQPGLSMSHIFAQTKNTLLGLATEWPCIERTGDMHQEHSNFCIVEPLR